MASPPSPTTGRRRAGSVAHSITSVSHSLTTFTEGVVLHRDPPPGFFAATAQATSQAPSVRDIRRGSFGKDGWQSGTARRSSVTDRPDSRRLSAHGAAEAFTPLTEEDTQGSATPDATRTLQFGNKDTALPRLDTTAATKTEQERTDHDRIEGSTRTPDEDPSGSDQPSKPSWTTSTWIGLKAFWKWFTTPFGFFVTLYGLNVVAWGGMLFLLLCNASPAMCHAPVPTPENQKHMSPADALDLPGPYYFNCNDINSPRRIWIEIDSQILNALFCVTGLGLIPWRFRDLYYLLRWRLTSEKRYGRERKMYGLRVLAGIYKSWFRLPGSDTRYTLSADEYISRLDQAKQPTTSDSTLESAPSALSFLPENDPRIPLPISKKPVDPVTGIPAPPTKLWKLDFFIWCFCWNTFFQCCLCGFMWGMNRYARPPWSTGLFVALACIIAAIGGLTSFLEGKRIKKVEIVAPAVDKQTEQVDGHESRDAQELRQVATNATDRESIRLAGKEKSASP